MLTWARNDQRKGSHEYVLDQTRNARRKGGYVCTCMSVVCEFVKVSTCVCMSVVCEFVKVSTCVCMSVVCVFVCLWYVSLYSWVYVYGRVMVKGKGVII